MKTSRFVCTGRPALPVLALCGLFTLSLVHGAESDPPSPSSPSPSASSRAEDPEVVKLDEFVVVGDRASIVSALEIKQAKAEITDSIVASDINKLPDINVTDALQRITGIQILRDRGEGSSVTIRGLSQMETTLNGREVFLAGLNSTGAPSRTMDFADVPAEMVSGIDVYKTASADHIEGGIGGLIDMRTRRPFDFNGLQAIANVRFIHGDLVDKTKPQYSGLVSNRWKLSGGGEVGVLVNLIFQDRAWREDQMGTGAPASRADIITGQTVNAQSSASQSSVFGTRERSGIAGVFQWRPSDQLELYAEYNYTEMDTIQTTHQVNLSGATPVPGSAVLSPGTNDVQSITWTNPTIAILSFARDTHDWTKQYAAGGIYRNDQLTVKFDASYTDSYQDLYFAGPLFAATDAARAPAQFAHDLVTQVPSVTVTGIDLLDPANFEYTSVTYRYRPYYGDLKTATLDATYNIGEGFLHTVSAGLRYGKRWVTNRPGLIFADFNYAPPDTRPPRPPATMWPELVENMQDGFFPGAGSPKLDTYMTGVLNDARDIEAFRALYGITDPIPEEAGLLSLYTINEKTTAAYLMGRFSGSELPFDGNIGVRFVQTEEDLSGFQTIPATETTPQTTGQIDVNSKYDNVLPSLNARYRLSDGLYARFAASKSLTRPNFNQLSPSLTLVPNPINPELNQGSAGNPDLKPFKSDNVDLAVEKYFNEATSLYGTIFYKKVDGFIVSSRETETYDGQPYLISRPRNAAEESIKGVEVGYTQFFDFLPDPWKGFGVQANYTYLDTDLQGMSKHSYNLIGMYETRSVSVRVAYNWRDTFRSGQQSIVNIGAVDIFTEDYGWLDASVNYRVNENISVGLEGSNLLKTKRSSYFGVPNRPQNVYINDLQIGLVLTYRM